MEWKEEFKPVEEKIPFSEVEIQKVENYWNSRPCNIRHSPLPIGTKEYFDEVEARKYKVEPHIPSFANFSNYKGKKVLEIGCGLGTETVNFVRAGAIVTVIELSQKSLSLCAERLKVFGLNATLIQGNGEQIEELLQSDSLATFDLVWSFGVIHHTPRPEKVIEQCYKMLKPGGELKIMVYSKVSYKLFFLMRETNCWNFSKKGVDAILSEYSEEQVGCPVTFSYTLDEARELVKDGELFRVNEIFKDHIFCWDIGHYREYRYVKDEIWANVEDDQLRSLEKELGWHTCL